jgi:GntR family transcriptional regulator / MocR family aminotransferase
VLCFLPLDVDEPALLAAAARHDVGIEGLSVHSYTGECPRGRVLGHGYLAEPAIERGVRLLAQALGATSGAHQM